MIRSVSRNLVLVSGLALVMLGCGEDSSTNPTQKSSADAIAITKIEVLIPMDDDSNITYRIDYTYTLASMDSAMMGFVFNSAPEYSSFMGSPGSDTIVAKGTMSGSKNVTARYKNWGARGRFVCHADLSAPDHGMIWSPLAVSKDFEAPAR